MNEEEYEGDSDCESVDEELEEDIISRMTPDLELAHPEYGPPLCVSAGRGNTACLRVLLQAGADVNCVSEDGRWVKEKRGARERQRECDATKLNGPIHALPNQDANLPRV